MAKFRICQLERSGRDRDDGAAARRVDDDPALTRPISVMNRPMPTPMARLRSAGMALSMASRKPTSTDAVTTGPRPRSRPSPRAR